MACPLPKQQRSTYQHLDSIEPTTWACIVAALKDLGITSSAPLSIYPSDSAAIDAFARLRVSNPTTIFDSQTEYDLQNVQFQAKITNTSGNATITHNAPGSEALLYVEAEDVCIRQSRRYIRYQPGKSQLVLMTFVMDSPTALCTQRVGYFDADNGIFLEDSGSGYNLVIRSSTSGSPDDNDIPQASWNIDSFDGNGPSGVLLDFTKAQILVIDFEWLGVGRVRVGFVIDGIPYYAHQFLHSNVISGVYMSTANLPIRYEIEGAAGLVGGKTLQAICSSVSSEGGFHVSSGLQFAVDNEITLRSVTSAAYLPLLAIRPKLQFNSITNRGRIIPSAIEIYSATNPIHYDVIWGGAVTGGAWASANANSIVEYNVTGTSVAGGIDVQAGYVAASQQSRGHVAIESTDDYPIFLDVDGNHPTSPYTDEFIIAARALSTSSNCGAALEFGEYR